MARDDNRGPRQASGSEPRTDAERGIHADRVSSRRSRRMDERRRGQSSSQAATGAWRGRPPIGSPTRSRTRSTGSRSSSLEPSEEGDVSATDNSDRCLRLGHVADLAEHVPVRMSVPRTRPCRPTAGEAGDHPDERGVPDPFGEQAVDRPEPAEIDPVHGADGSERFVQPSSLDRRCGRSHRSRG